MARDVKQRMIERTAVLLAKKGLHRASFTEILEASGAPRGSLYHHFPGGKDELVLAALGIAGQQAMAVLDKLSGRPASEVATTFIALWRAVLTKSDFEAGCAVAAVTVAADSTELMKQAAKVFREWRAHLTRLFEDGGIESNRARSLAANLVSACEGAVVLARAERSLEPFDLMASEQLATVRGAMKRKARKS